MSNKVLEYIGLDLNNIPDSLNYNKPIYKIAKSFDNSELYKIYKEISIKDLVILIGNSDRTTDIKMRYEQAMPINEFIKDNKEYFCELAEKTSIEEIEELENLQKKLANNTPFFIKYDKNYLWQIYYSQENDKYFMLFPAKEGETAVIFYILKKKLEKEDSKIFVPICKADYNERILSKKEINDLENYLWIFTKNWPTIYEVTRENTQLNIIGTTKLTNRLESKYKMNLISREDAINTYTLIKALFMLVTETDYEYEIVPKIDENRRTHILL